MGPHAYLDKMADRARQPALPHREQTTHRIRQAGLRPGRLLAEATELHRAGRLLEAERIYRRILHQEPATPTRCTARSGRQTGGPSEAAIRLLRQAIANNPGAPSTANLAMMYEEEGRFAEAEREAPRALRAGPGHRCALHCLANAQRAQDRYAEAADSYARATQRDAG